MTRRIVGVILVASPFVAVAVFAYSIAWWVPLITFGLTFLVVGLIGIGHHLLK